MSDDDDFDDHPDRPLRQQPGAQPPPPPPSHQQAYRLPPPNQPAPPPPSRQLAPEAVAPDQISGAAVAGRAPRLLVAVVAVVALLVVALIALGLAGLVVGADEPSAASTITEGDCFTEFSAFEAEPGAQTTVGPVNPADCAAPHALEAYYVGTAYVGLGEEYPLLDILDDVAITECEKRFERFVDAEWETSELDFWWLTPSEEGWAQGDRELICLVGDYEKTLTSGTLGGAGR